MAEKITKKVAEDEINQLSLSEKLGMRITVSEPGISEGRLLLNELHKNTLDSVHGGILFILADSTAGAAAKSLGRRVTTAQCNVQFIRSALGTELFCKSKVIRAGRRLIWVDAEICDDQGCLVCRANLEFFALG